MSAAFDPVPLIARDLKLPPAGVAAVVALLAEGATVPFIARYRKERTGGLDEVQIRAVREQAAARGELEARRATVLGTIEAQGKLTDELRRQIERCETRAALEDLYLPYKPKRRTRATIAREKGLEPLAERILRQPRDGDPLAEARRFVSAERDVPDAEAALAGARDIVAEAMNESAPIRAFARERFVREGHVVAKAGKGAKDQRTRFEQYYDYREPARSMPSHRILAVLRGEREGALKVGIDAPTDAILGRAEQVMRLEPRSPFAGPLREAIADGYKRLLAPAVENDVRGELKARADEGAVDVFAQNLRDLLLAAPLGARPVIAVDPGLRTGCKCAALDETGRHLAHVTLFPGQGAAREAQAERDLVSFVARHRPFAVAVGNGTGGREMAAFARRVLEAAGHGGVVVVEVNESGASVYSASEFAGAEFPDLDVTVRGAISIGRRLQDPLAELVKIDPRSIGVGQYQHDVQPGLLERKLEEVVESCVNHVGAELNTASAPLLARVAGIGPKLAERVVAHRESHGAFRARRELLDVKGLGPRTYEQAAGFLRIRGAAYPLDASAVHPERYALVERIARDLRTPLGQLIGRDDLLERVDLRRYIDDDVGEPTLRDILAELRKPGRDPRASFEPPRFRDDVQSPEDLEPGMALEGVVTNVTNFGAFVDIGVHQDGLVHVSQLADRFVRDPHEVVKAGDRLTVRVLSVDLERRRISLTARSQPAPERAPSGGAR